MNKTAKRGKNKARHALYLSKWCYTTKSHKNSNQRKLKPLAKGSL